MLKVELLIIDPNNDFCEKGPDPENIEGQQLIQLTPKNNNLMHMPYQGSLYVPGAGQDMVRLAAMIDRLGRKLTDIHVTIDCHHYFSIFHPCFLIDRNGNHPAPYTLIPYKDIVDKVYRASVPSLQEWLEYYTKTLDDNGRYPYMIWPYHCLIQTPGSCIYPELLDALLRWEASPGMVDKVVKGSNFKTEHYSAVKAEVIDPEDKGTMLNTRLVSTLEGADLLPTCGEASNFCFMHTLLDIIKEFGEDAAKKFVILTDATSPVLGTPELEEKQKFFMNEMRRMGVQFSTTTEFLA